MSRAGRSLLEPSRVAAVAVLFSIPAKLLSERLIDPDLWWHLRTGAYITATHRIPHADIYSYSAPGRRWVVQEWGSEVILHGIRKAFGLYGLFVWRAVMLFAIYAIVARLLVRRMGSGIGTWVLFALVAYAGASNWTERPNLFSFLLLVVTLGLVERRGRAIWWFVPIAALWANLHGMVILGIGLLAVVAVAEGLKAATRWPGADGEWAKRLGVVTVAGLIATFANPAGPGLIVNSFRLVRVVSSLVTEWASPNFHEWTAFLFIVLLLVTVAALALHPERPDPTDVALALAFTVLALQAARNLAVAAIVLGYVAARWLPGTMAAVRDRFQGSSAAPAPVAPSPLIGAVALAVALGGLGIVAVAKAPRSERSRDIVDAGYPLSSFDALDRPGVRVFAFDFWAGYIIDTAWPNVHVYHDTRVDMYGPEQTRRYARAIAALPGWRETLDQSCTTHVLVRPRRDPLAEVLRLEADWAVESEGARSVTFVRRSPAPECERFPIPPPGPPIVEDARG